MSTESEEQEAERRRRETTLAPFSEVTFRRLAAGRLRALGTPLTVVESTGSTNDDAAAAARDGAAHGATFVAEAQTAGRGRQGRRWIALPRSCLLASVLLRPALSWSAASGAALVVGLALREALSRFTDAPLALKWPNDVMGGDRKLAGILVESQSRGGALESLVVGFGINVGVDEFPLELQARATSLALLGARSVSREALLVEALASLERRLADLTAPGVEGLGAETLAEFARHDWLLGRALTVDGARATGRGLDAQGRLLVEDASGHRRAVLAATIEPC